MRETLGRGECGRCRSASWRAAPAPADKLKVCFVYVGPHNDGGWTPAARHGRPGGREGARRQGRDDLRRERARRARTPSAPSSAWPAAGCKHHLHHLVRLHGPDAQGRGEVPGREVRARHRLQDRAERHHLQRPLLRGPLHHRARSRRRCRRPASPATSSRSRSRKSIMGINAFMLGAQSVNPDFKVKIVWVNTWFDPGKEADAAKALFDQGADIIAQHTDSPAAMQIAEERGLHGFGQSHDMIDVRRRRRSSPRSSTTGARTTSSASRRCSTAPGSRRRAGTASDERHRADGAATPTCPTTSKAMAEDTQEKIKSGELHPFTGPIDKQDGTRGRCRPARSLDDGTLLGMNWYVKGVDDTPRARNWRRRKRIAPASATRRARSRTAGATRFRRRTSRHRSHVRLPRRLAEPARPLGPSRGGHRLDRHVVLFHRPRPQPAQARAHARRRLRHRLGGARRRLLSRREIPGGAEDAARPTSSGTNGRPTSPGSPASRSSSSSTTGSADAFLIDRVGAAAPAVAGDRHLGRSASPAAGSSTTGSASRRSARTRRCSPSRVFVLIVAAAYLYTPRLFRPRRPHPCRRLRRHDHGGQRLRHHHPQPEEDHRRADRRASRPTRRSAPSASSARSTTTT